MASKLSCEYADRSMRLDSFWTINPLVFQLEPRCQGFCVSQK